MQADRKQGHPWHPTKWVPRPTPQALHTDLSKHQEPLPPLQSAQAPGRECPPHSAEEPRVLRAKDCPDHQDRLDTQ